MLLMDQKYKAYYHVIPMVEFALRGLRGDALNFSYAKPVTESSILTLGASVTVPS